MKKLDNRVTVPVVDRFGYLVEEQEYRNTPLAELYPDEQVILIQWTAEHDNTRPSVEELSDARRVRRRELHRLLRLGFGCQARHHPRNDP